VDLNDKLKGRRLGRVLTLMGKITREQAHEALNIQGAKREAGASKRLGEILVDLGYVTNEDVLSALAYQARDELLRDE